MGHTLPKEASAKGALLLQRLDAIGRSLASSDQALALIGLGSVGVELARLDEYSDLDFFVIARDGYKEKLIADLAWLTAVHPLVYAFKNTVDGYKVLFEDEVYGEFAVLEVRELEAIPFAEGRIIWQAPGFDESLVRPRRGAAAPEARTAEWLLGEALTCLYVGLGRYHRGEKLSAFRFVQVFAVDRVVELAALLEQEAPAWRDEFSPERRFERRFPETARALAAFMAGYEDTPASARALVEFLDRHWPVNGWLKAAILKRCQGG